MSDAAESPLKDGTTTGWLVVHSGVGAAMIVKAVAVVDGESGFIQVDGDWEETTVVDDALA